MSNHTAQSNRNTNPRFPAFSTPSISHISDGRVDEGEAEGPETHFGFFVAVVAACEHDYDAVAEEAGSHTVLGVGCEVG